MLKFVLNSLDDLPEVSEKIAEVLTPGVWLLHGEMGAGKTTLVAALCNAMGVEDRVSSPTFSLVNEYQTNQGETLYHFDFYRISSSTEALDMGADEYFHSNNVCLVEWPDRVADILENVAGSIWIRTEGEQRNVHVVPDENPYLR